MRVRSKVLVVGSACMGLLAANAEVLFSDSFNRPDNFDIDAVSTGMGGSAAPMTYSESDSIAGVDGLTQVSSNVLYTAYGPNASVIGLTSHNFIDVSILSAGGFSISMDVQTLGGAADQDRYAGFGVGLSSSEISNLGYDYNTNSSPRGQWDGTPGGVADFYVSWSPYDNGIFDSIQIFTADTTGGSEFTTLPDGIADGTFGTLRADFFVSDFNAGSMVNVDVFFNDVLITSTSFLWNGTGENYIALSSRQNTGIVIDNLEITTDVTPPPEPYSQLLFSDSFARSTLPSNDLDADMGGMGGLLVSNGTFTAGNTWLEPQDVADAEDTRTRVDSANGGELWLANGTGTSHAMLDHNFVDDAILTNGRFRVVLDRINIDSASNERHLGFGVGTTYAEATGYGDRYLQGVADLFVSTTLDGGEVEVRQNGVSVFLENEGVDLNGATLSATFDIIDFNAGSPVQYEIFLQDSDFNGGFETSITSGTFYWSDSNANYIGLDARASTRAIGDNFAIYAEEGGINGYVTTLHADPVVIEGTDTVSLVWTAYNFPSGSTYGVTANKAVTWSGGNQTGSITAPTGSVDAVVYGANGDVTFTMVFSNELNEAVSTNMVDVQVFKNKRPNVIVILCDDTGWGDYGCYGSEVNTPNIDSLAETGLRFRNFYQAARCSPSRCAILSGLYTQQAAVSPAAPLPNLRSDNNVTIAEVLGAAGYHTYMAGKWHIGTAGDKVPLARGFEHAFGYGANAAGSNTGATFGYWDSSLYHLVSTGNAIPAHTFTNQFHYSDAIGDYSVDFINYNEALNDGRPFFLYMPFNAPHWPVNGPGALADKYTDVGQDPAGTNDVDICLYEEGWDVIREKKYQRMLDTGVIDERWINTPRGDSPGYPTGIPIPDWDTLSPAQKKDEARRMAVYAAMIEQVDSNIGKVLARLEELGELDNTFIFLVNDNGANYEGGVFGNSDNPNTGVWATADLPAMGQPWSKYDELGISYTKYPRVNIGGGWANIGNMPYRLFKHFTHAGGIRTPAILHYPNGMAESVKGTWTDEIGHLVDVMATVVDVSGADYPSNFNGHAVLPMEGESLMPAALGEPMPVRDIAVEHEANRAFFRGKWKFVTKNFNFSDGSSPAHQAELYNIEEDPCEMNNLASVETEKLQEMVVAWTAWLLRVYNVSDVSQLPAPQQSKWGPTINLAYDIVVDANPAIATGPKDLFTDTFARADDADADAFYLGMHGSRYSSLGQNNTYYEGYNPGNVSIAGTQLRMATADNGLMHNFIGQDILDAGGFSVSLAVVDESSATSAGFGVGLSQAEASSPGVASASDGYVELDAAGYLSFYNNGSLLGSVNVGSATGRVDAAFAFNSFAASSNVAVTVFFNGEPALSGLSFTWDSTDHNYIGVSAVAAGYVDLDNLAIRKLPIGDSMASQYALDSGLDGDDTDPARDTDADRLDQYAEWIWGGDPNVADYDNSKVVLTEASLTNGFNFTYRRLRNAAVYDVAYETFATTSLMSNDWWTVPVEETGTVTIPSNTNYEVVNVRIPDDYAGTNEVLFVLVRAGASD